MDCREIYRNIQRNVIHGMKVPHGVSMPVVRLIDGQYYFAVFVFYYTKDDLDTGTVNRPSLWASVDIASGEIVGRYRAEREFSDAPYDTKYNVYPSSAIPLSKEDYEQAFRLLDEIRNKLLCNAPFPKDIYEQYLELVLKSIPDDYRRFYHDLSL